MHWGYSANRLRCETPKVSTAPSKQQRKNVPSALLTNPGPIWGFKSLRARQPISNVSANSDFLSGVSTILAPRDLMLPKSQTFTIVVRTVPRLSVRYSMLRRMLLPTSH